MPTVPPLADAARPAEWRWPPLLRASAVAHAGAAALAVVPGEWALSVAAVAANHALITAAGLWPRGRWLGPNVTRLPSGRSEVSITIDDGPDPEVTPAVLDQLDAAAARATFFVIGTRATRHRALVRDMLRRGHDVQNHSHRHLKRFSLLGPHAMAREIADSQALLADLTGRVPHAFRPPAGLRNPFLDPLLHREGLHLVSWTRRAFDTREGNPAVVLQRLSRGLAAGDIVLLHDGHARRTPQGRPVVLEVLPALLERCRMAGLAPVTLRDALPPRHSRPA